MSQSSRVNSSETSGSQPNARTIVYMRCFGILLLVYEIFICIIYGYVLKMSSNSINRNDLLIPASIALIVLVGFGLRVTKWKKMTLGGISFTIFLFAITIQQYFLARQFWYMAKISSSENTGFSTNPLSIIQLTNTLNNRQQSQSIKTASFADAMACGLCMIISMGTVLGRIGPIQIFILGLLGPMIYQLNNQILWNIFVTDCGFGMRVFLFGSTLSIISSYILSRKPQIAKNGNLSMSQTSKINKTYTFIGTIIIWIFFPSLCLVDVYNDLGNDKAIVPVVAFNMWFALISTFISVAITSLFIHNKFQILEIVKYSFVGAIAFSSSADLIFNPAFPLTVGTLMGAFMVWFHNYILKYIYAFGLIDSYGSSMAYFFPSFVGGILSAVLQSTGAGSLGTYNYNTNPAYSNFKAGGFQIAGMSISFGLGIVAGIIMGVFYLLLKNLFPKNGEFKDQVYFQTIFYDEQNTKEEISKQE